MRMTSSNTEHEIGPKMTAEVINDARSISRLLCMCCVLVKLVDPRRCSIV